MTNDRSTQKNRVSLAFYTEFTNIDAHSPREPETREKVRRLPVMSAQLPPEVAHQDTFLCWKYLVRFSNALCTLQSHPRRVLGGGVPGDACGLRAGQISGYLSAHESKRCICHYVVKPHVRHEASCRYPPSCLVLLPSTIQPTTLMELGPRTFWETVLDTIDIAIRILGHALPSKEGREFVCGLGPRDASLCLELLDRVSRHPPFPCSLYSFVGSSRSPSRRKVEKDIPPHTNYVGWSAWTAPRLACDSRSS